MTTTRARGRAGSFEWDLRWEPTGPPLWTFPRWAWRRKVLPAAQVVPIPVTRLTGSLGTATYDGTGAIAHIDGHGNAQRWVWLHAALGNGDILELVSATARRPGLRALPALALLQLRLDGKDWPRDSLAAAPLFTTRIDDQAFRIRGVVGGRRLTAEVTLPAERCVSWRLCGTAHAEIGTRP